MKLAGGFLLIVACAASLLFNKHHQQTIREREWVSALAIIEDARIQLSAQSNSQGGGAMLYEVDVLAKYLADGKVREQWTIISQLPKLLADAQLQAHLLKKKQCIVRWKPTAPDRIVAEIN